MDDVWTHENCFEAPYNSDLSNILLEVQADTKMAAAAADKYYKMNILYGAYMQTRKCKQGAGPLMLTFPTTSSCQYLLHHGRRQLWDVPCEIYFSANNHGCCFLSHCYKYPLFFPSTGEKSSLILKATLARLQNTISGLVLLLYLFSRSRWDTI